MLSAALSSRAGTSWHELSRAQQLQQLASNSNKHHPSGNQCPAPPPPPSQPGIPSLGQPSSSSSSWAGPSPPYRSGEKHPNSSPHQQPFSPAGSSIQSPQSSHISSLAPAPAQGPSPPYRPEKLASPALAQPPFSPQNTLLPSGSVPATGGAIQGSQASYLPSVGPGSTGSTRPSPPYRQDTKHGSPSIVPHQNGSGNANMTNSQLFKAITSSQPAPSSLKLLMQQGQASAQMQGQPTAQSSQPMVAGPLGKAGGQDSFSFNNTKPLRHFDPDPAAQQKMSAGHPPAGHGPMGPSYRGPSMQPTPPTSAASHAHLLQQRMQRVLHRGGATGGPGGMVPICREVSYTLNHPSRNHLSLCSQSNSKWLAYLSACFADLSHPGGI